MHIMRNATACVLGCVLACSFAPMAFAADNDAPTPNSPRSQTELSDRAAKPILTVGASGSEDYASMQALFDDPSVSGAVVVQLTGDVTEAARTDATGPLVVPARFTSLTIESDSAGVARTWIVPVDVSATKAELAALFANGRDVTIGAGVTATGDPASYPNDTLDLFGGAYESDAVGSPQLVVAGEVTDNVFGGGFNGDLDGSPTITVNGSVQGMVVGGGLAEAFDLAVQETRSANVSGSASIVIESTGSALVAIGGGYAQSLGNGAGGASTPVDDVFADVAGGASVDIQGALSHGAFNATSVVGGGFAYAKDGSARVRANVDGATSIVFGASAQTHDWMALTVTGGGYARVDSPGTGAVLEASADVSSASIEAVEDDEASNEQLEERWFERFSGGGYAFGSSAHANVTGDVRVATARRCYDGDAGLIGGGSAHYGATANVVGAVSVRVQPIAGQVDDYENADRVHGGGYAIGNGRKAGMALAPSTADVGSSEVVVCANAVMGDDGTGISVAGGGFADGYASTTGDAAYDACSARARVLGDASVRLEDHVSMFAALIGGGNAVANADASVEGATHVETGSGCSLGSYFGTFVGGGRASGYDAVARTEKGVDVSLRDGFSCRLFYGGGFADDEGDASVGSSGAPAQVSVACVGTGASQLSTSFVSYMGGCASDAGSRADVQGSIIASFDGMAPKSSLYVGCYAPGGGSAHVSGDVELAVANASVPASLYAGGFAGDNAGSDAGVDGDASVSLVDATAKAVYVGGKGGGDQDEADVAGNAYLDMSGVSSVAQLCTAGYEYADVQGDARVSITGVQTAPSVLYGEGYDGATANTLGTTSLVVGDGVTPTKALVASASGIDDVSVTKQATLAHASATASGAANTNKLFWNLKTLSVDEGGTLALTNANTATKQEQASGAFAGGGTIKLLAGRSIAFGGAAAGSTAIEIDGTPQLGETYVSVGAAGAGTFSYDGAALALANGESGLPQLWKIVERAAATHAVAVDVRKDGAPWADHGRAVTLAAADGTELTDLSAVPDGAYDVRVDGEEARVSVIVNGADASACVDYWTVSFAARDAGAASGSTIEATADGKAIASGDDVLHGSAVILAARGAGAAGYSFAWSGSGIAAADGDAVCAEALAEPIDAVCTVTGLAIPAPDDNQIAGIEAGVTFELGDTVTFTAVGGGMDNAAPSTGDRRWVPRSWKVNPSGAFAPEGPFTASFDTTDMAAGLHELKVTYGLEEYDGAAWADTGVTDTRSVPFTLVKREPSHEPGPDPVPVPQPLPEEEQGPGSDQPSSALAPTGDAVPIAAIALGALGVCAVGVALLAMRKLKPSKH